MLNYFVLDVNGIFLGDFGIFLGDFYLNDFYLGLSWTSFKLGFVFLISSKTLLFGVVFPEINYTLSSDMKFN